MYKLDLFKNQINFSIISMRPVWIYILGYSQEIMKCYVAYGYR